MSLTDTQSSLAQNAGSPISTLNITVNLYTTHAQFTNIVAGIDINMQDCIVFALDRRMAQHLVSTAHFPSRHFLPVVGLKAMPAAISP